MSHFDRGNDRFNWVEESLKISVIKPPGCVQCGSRLEKTETGQYSLSGRCINCSGWQFNADDDFYDFEG